MSEPPVSEPPGSEAPGSDPGQPAAPGWVTARSTGPEGLPAEVRVDEGAALAAPWPGLPVQVCVGVPLARPDEGGQPGLTEQPALRQFERAFAAALGPPARVVAAVTMAGVREIMAYAPDAGFIERWQTGTPAGMELYPCEVHVLADPGWTGLRELAGLLEPGEQVVRPDPDEIDRAEQGEPPYPAPTETDAG